MQLVPVALTCFDVEALSMSLVGSADEADDAQDAQLDDVAQVLAAESLQLALFGRSSSEVQLDATERDRMELQLRLFERTADARLQFALAAD